MERRVGRVTVGIIECLGMRGGHQGHGYIIGTTNLMPGLKWKYQGMAKLYNDN